MTVTTETTARRIIEDTTAIARIPAPTGAEGRRVAWLETRLHGVGGDLGRDEVGNLRWSFGAPPHQLMLLVHLDTVFDESVDHEAVERDGWLHGPGVGDNSVAVATAVDVVERIDPSLRSGLAVVFTVGEEGLGGLEGARHACATIPAAQVIALEGHGLDSVFVDAVGCHRVEITVDGPGGHSWWDRGRPSAVHELVALLDRLVRDQPPGLALNVGLVEGGTTVNAIAARARAVIEGRALSEEPLEVLAGSIHEAVDACVLDAEVRVLDRRPSGRLDPTHPLAAAVLAVRDELGLRPALTDGSTDANAALAAGLPALALGCARGADMHARQERIEVASIAEGAAQLERVLTRLLAPTTTLSTSRES